MKAFNFAVKVIAFVLILYVVMQQKKDYYAELRGKPTPPAATTETKPASAAPATAPIAPEKKAKP